MLCGLVLLHLAVQQYREGSAPCYHALHYILSFSSFPLQSCHYPAVTNGNRAVIPHHTPPSVTSPPPCVARGRPARPAARAAWPRPARPAAAAQLPRREAGQKMPRAPETCGSRGVQLPCSFFGQIDVIIMNPPPKEGPPASDQWVSSSPTYGPSGLVNAHSHFRIHTFTSHTSTGKGPDPPP